jgi:molecular chaperone DnaK
MLISDARAAMAEDAPIDRLRSLTAELHQMGQALASSSRGADAGAAGSASGGQGGQGGQGASGSDDDEVIDAEFTTN